MNHWVLNKKDGWALYFIVKIFLVYLYLYNLILHVFTCILEWSAWTSNTCMDETFYNLHRERKCRFPSDMDLSNILSCDLSESRYLKCNNGSIIGMRYIIIIKPSRRVPPV